MGLVSMGGAEKTGNAKGQDLGLDVGGCFCVNTVPEPAFWGLCCHSLMIVTLVELVAWRRPPILLFLSSYSLAPFITEIITSSLTPPKPNTAQPERLKLLCFLPLLSPDLPLPPLAPRNSVVPLFVQQSVFD